MEQQVNSIEMKVEYPVNSLILLEKYNIIYSKNIDFWSSTGLEEFTAEADGSQLVMRIQLYLWINNVQSPNN